MGTGPINDSPARTSVAAALLLVCGVGLLLVPRPPVDNSLESWMDIDSPAGREYSAFAADFGTDDVVVVQLSGPEEAALRFAVQVEEAFQADPTIHATLGPRSAFSDEFDLLLDEGFGFAELPRLRPRFDGPLNRSLGLATGERARVFALGKPAKPAARAALVKTVERLRLEAKTVGLDFYAAGHPLLNIALDEAGATVESRGMPLLIGLCVVLLLASTRSPRLTLAAFVPVALGVLGTEGAYSLLGHSTNIVVNIAKPLLFVVLLASGLHVIVAFQDRLRTQDKRAAAIGAARDKTRGVLLALGTTAVGFGSLGLADLGPIRAFGLFVAGGLVFGAALTLVLLPQILALVGGRPAAPTTAFGALAARLVARSGRLWVIGALVVVGFGAYAATTLETEPHAIRYFDQDHPVRADHHAIEASGMGLFTVECVVQGAPLEAIERFAAAATARDDVLARADLPLLVREAGFRAAGTRDWPADPVVEDALKSPNIAQFRASDRVRVSLLISTLDASQLDALETGLRALGREHLPGATLGVTGSYRLLLQAQRTLLHTLWTSLLATAVLMELVLLLAVRDFRVALAALLPNAFPVAVNFLVMAAIGIPLDVGTSMTAAVALGIAVDDTLHFISGWRPDDPGATARSTGRALILSSLVIGLGFLALLSADFAPTRRFAGLSALAMVTALIADLLILPALLPRARTQ